MLRSTRSTVAAWTLPMLLAFSTTTMALAQEPPAPRERVIRVSAEGEASIAPDIAIVSFSVVRNSQTAQVAMDQNSQAMNAVMAALKSQGVEAKDIQTSNFSIQPQYRHFQPKEDGTIDPPEVVGYEVTNTLMVKIRDIAKVGTILDRVVKLGVNQGGQIVFTNDDPEAAFTEARKQAVERAIAKARTLTEAAGIRLGQVIQIDENARPPMPPQPMSRMAMAKEAAFDAVPVAAGENTYAVRVDLTFALEQ
nr:SIMPL domain-containing protein [Rhizobium sp. Q54]